MLGVASDGLVAPPGLLDHPSDLSQLSVNAVVGSRPVASDLAKDVAGARLLSGVSFKLGRRDRVTLSGRNGSG